MTPAPAAAAVREEPRPARSGGLLVVATAAAVALLYFGSALFVTLAFALFLAFAMRPFVSLLERAGVPRVLAILLLIFLLIGGVVLLVINVTAQFNDLYDQLPRYQDRIRELVSSVMSFVDRLRARMGSILPQDAQGVREVKISESPLSTTRAFMASIGTGLHFLLYAAAVPFLTFFMLKDREKFGRVIEGMFVRSRRFGDVDVTGAISAKMTSYALGLAFVMLIMASATTATLMILRVNYYYLLGPLAGLAILVPYVGVLFSTIPAVAVAFFQFGMSKAVIVFVVYTCLQFLEGNVLTPFIVGGKVRLFPLTIMVAFIFWGMLWGVAGAMLAVPLTSAMKVVCEHVSGWEGFARLLGDPDPPPRL